MYQTDLTDAQWQIINNCVEYKARKRKHSLRSVWNAIMYVVKTGCQWLANVRLSEMAVSVLLLLEMG